MVDISGMKGPSQPGQILNTIAKAALVQLHELHRIGPRMALHHLPNAHGLQDPGLMTLHESPWLCKSLTSALQTASLQRGETDEGAMRGGEKFLRVRYEFWIRMPKNFSH
jgi:hypothetical protein